MSSSDPADPSPVGHGSRRRYSREALAALVGQEAGVSDWVLVTQAMIDRFADVSGDRQFIHIDPERARQTPFGSTVAHGFLITSLLSVMGYQGAPALAGAGVSINYGFDRLRFVRPVTPGQRIRGRFTLKALADRPGGDLMLTWDVVVEAEGQDPPALVATWLVLHSVGPSSQA